MSAEAPKNTGVVEPITPQKPEGGFSGLFRRLFAVPSTTTSLQPSPGLEVFTDRIQHVVDDHVFTVRQQDLERRNAETARITNEAEERVRDAQRQEKLVAQEIAMKARDMQEVSQVLRDFQIEDRLKTIQPRSSEISLYQFTDVHTD
jgi:hypothetical protein